MPCFRSSVKPIMATRCHLRCQRNERGCVISLSSCVRTRYPSSLGPMHVSPSHNEGDSHHRYHLCHHSDIFSLKLLLDCDYIIRASTKIEKASPHVYMRCNKADGLSITEAVRLNYTHKDHSTLTSPTTTSGTGSS